MTMVAQKRIEVELYPFLTSALDVGEW